MRDQHVALMPGGAFDQLLVAVYDAPERRLDHLCKVIWGGYSSGNLTDDAADRLTEAITRRREVFRLRRQVASTNRRSATWRVEHPLRDSVKKRRVWSTGGALPGELRWIFTPGETAVAGVIRAEIQRKGRCTLPYRSIAKAAGLRSTTVVKRFIRQAKKHRLINVEERFGDRGLNRPNVITIISKEWLSWISYDGRGQQGGTAVPTDQRPRNRKEMFERQTLAKMAIEMVVTARIGEAERPPDEALEDTPNVGELAA